MVVRGADRARTDVFGRRSFIGFATPVAIGRPRRPRANTPATVGGTSVSSTAASPITAATPTTTSTACFAFASQPKVKEEGQKPVFSSEEIHRAYLDCRRRKRGAKNAIRFEMNLVENLDRLETELNSGSYQPSRSACFVNSRPRSTCGEPDEPAVRDRQAETQGDARFRFAESPIHRQEGGAGGRGGAVEKEA